MAIVVESVSTLGWTQSSTPTINKPAGIASGDLLVVHMLTRFDGPITPPAGWTLIRNTNNQGLMVYLGCVSYYRVCDGSEGASFQWTLGGSVWSNIGIYRISGADRTSPISADNGTTVDTTAAPSFSAAITPPDANSLLMMFLGVYPDNGLDVSTYAIATSNPSWTEAYDTSSTSPTGSGVGMAAAYGLRTETTSTGNFSCAISSGLPYWAGQIISIKPYIAVGPTNLKSYNTNLSANIKSINTNAISNVKSLNTNV